jgi:hypothetical protein
MRRLFILLAGIGLLSANAGCVHTGTCDCMPPIQPCCIYGLYPPAFGLPVLPPTAPAPTTTQAGAEVPAQPADATPTTPPMKENIGLPREL